MKRFTIIFCLISFVFHLRADEGMWIPLLLEKYNIEEMQEQGFRLSADDIYAVNKASLKDAVVIFGGGCTGELISDKGLLLTNHHCGHSYIQSHSSVESDYLTEGFWAMSMEEEIPNPGLSVTFLERIEDVTQKVLEGTENELTERARLAKVNENIQKIIAPLNNGKYKRAVIKPFYYGNEYYMFIYKIYTDVRLVGAPPGAIGNYGKDHDNWMWPRHTGDFSIFRVYVGPDNEPADYSPDNVPYTPKKHFTISLDGYEHGDFTMVMGYPGSTTQYYTPDAVEMLVNKSYPRKIEIRGARLDIMDKHMKEDVEIRIKYASKYRRVSNAWKKWQGIIHGLERVDAIEKKKQMEEEFRLWVKANEERNEKYGTVLSELSVLYEELSDYLLVYEYAGEAVLATELMDLMAEINEFLIENSGKSEEGKKEAKDKFLMKVDEFFKNYHQPIDEEIYAAVLKAFYQDINSSFHPDVFQEIHTRYKGNYLKFAKKQFKKTNFNTKDEVYNFFADYPEKEANLEKELMKDRLFQTFLSFSEIYTEEVNARFSFLEDEIQYTYRTYMKGLREMHVNEVLYPDANFTMRVAYGEVEGYSPRDAVIYKYETTLSGVINKYETGLPDYSLPEKLLNLYEQKDYGRYGSEDGQMNVCFIASNHTSGGNSGSPVLNANGELIGLNFDRNWEGTMSDIFYDKSQCRNISVDIRYILFIIDKFADAGYLIEEMDIVQN
ncbi:MAG: S46 family peptidase [Bacteroidota bacterium]